VVDREEAMKLFDSIEKQGHVHLAFCGFTMFADAPQFMGTCNCCTCCCGILHGPKLAGLDPSTQGPQKSNYRAVFRKCLARASALPGEAIAGDAEDEMARRRWNGEASDVGVRDGCPGCD
jgi:hypothetical protein